MPQFYWHNMVTSGTCHNMPQHATMSRKMSSKRNNMPHDFHMSRMATTSSRGGTSSPEPAPRSERLGPPPCLRCPQCPERPGRRWARCARCAQCKGHWRGHPLEDPPGRVATHQYHQLYSTYINIPQKCHSDISTMFNLFHSCYSFLCSDVFTLTCLEWTSPAHE